MSFYRKIRASVRLAVLSQFEYRFNFIIDAWAQPLITLGVELLLWIAVFQSLGRETLNGFPQSSYLAYALWATFFGRVSQNWMYEFRMSEDIVSGRANGILVRPISFYEFYLGQFMGYKLVSAFISFLIPLGASFYFFEWSYIQKLPLALILLFCFLIFTHTLSFLVASGAFFMDKASSLTVVKNLLIVILSGELFPLDLLPPAIFEMMLWTPFPAGVYVPVGYVTGRLSSDHLLQSLFVLVASTCLLGLLAKFVWLRGLKKYSGQGA